ncbi:MAG: PEPxxWA-CTERM sorting domain-containing protein [Caulobacteraceae bacterium]|nr:PEPxxWA-CTERM sorting domain-containing protein [Caulobacteraceae bacterium]
MKISALLAGAALATTVAASAHAVTFAGFVQDGNATNMTWTETGTTGGTLTASAPVWFTFDVKGLPVTPMLATLTLNGTSTVAGSVSGGDVIQGGIDGTFMITVATPLDGTTDLLNGTFSGAQISGPDNGNSTSIQDNFTTGNVSYTTGLASKYLTFGTDTSGDAFSFSGTSLTVLALRGNSPASFKGVFAGNFAATSAGPGGQGVPEPATWAMMLVGAAAVGGVLRRARQASLTLA